LANEKKILADYQQDILTQSQTIQNTKAKCSALENSIVHPIQSLQSKEVMSDPMNIDQFIVNGEIDLDQRMGQTEKRDGKLR